MTFSPIAIVGRSCLLPGATTPAQLWQVVTERQNLVRSVPDDRWRLSAARAMGPADDPLPDRAWSDRGGYVDGFHEIWQPDGFAVPEDELQGLDDLFLWLLHCAREALHEAGDDRRGPVRRDRVTAVFGNLGFPTAEMSRYAESVWHGEAQRPDARNRFMSGGSAELLQRALGLRDDVFCLDAACASSLYALAIACDRLHDGSADLALAGAVNRADDLFLHVGFSALKALSLSGRSRPFHAEADGLVPAEGCGFVALKRLEDARRDGDEVFGILRGIGLSNDGRGRGFLAPSAAGQRRALDAAYEIAGLRPVDVSLLECHATGTVVGDGTELESTGALYEGCTGVPIGSLKSNMGHLVTAAGVAALIKVTEALRHGVRPPSIHEGATHPALASGPFRLLTSSEPWDVEGDRIAGISAFGFGGNNAHVLVSDPRTWAPSSESSARTEGRTQALAIVGLSVVPKEALEQGAAETVDVGLKGLSFPPDDLRDTLSQQILVLEAAREATRDIDLEGHRTGIWIGLEPDPEICRYGARWRLGEHPAAEHLNDDQLASVSDRIVSSLRAAGVVGTMPNIPANRLNRQLDVGGLGFSISAGRRSGSCALSLASRALTNGEVDMALVGAVEIGDNAVNRAALQDLLSQGGETGSFADPTDAAIVVLLRRVEDARDRGEKVLGALEIVPADGSEADLDTDSSGKSWSPATDLLRLASCLQATGEPHVGCTWDAGGFGRFRIRPGGSTSYLVEPFVARFQAPDRKRMIENLQSGSPLGLESSGSFRVAVVAADEEQFRRRRDRAVSHLRHGIPAGPGVFVREKAVEGETAFVFGGAGAAYPGMGEALQRNCPELVDDLAKTSPVLVETFRQAWPEDESDVSPLHRLWSSSALCQLHARLSERLGLKADAVIGYSSGESNSLFASGIWRDQDQMVEDARRSGIFTEEIGGRLEAVQRAWGRESVGWETWIVLAPLPEVEAALVDEARVHLAIIHTDRDCVVSGDPEGCQRVIERVGRSRCLRLHYDLAVHVPELEEVREPWLDLHRREVHPRSDLRVYSGAHQGSYAPGREACALAILGQGLATLDFRRVVESAWADGVRIFVEHGPQGSCSRWIREILGDRDAVVVALDRRGKAPEALAEAAAQLWTAGVELRLEEVAAIVGDASIGHPEAAPGGGTDDSVERRDERGPTLTLSIHPPDLDLPRWIAETSLRPREGMESMIAAPALPARTMTPCEAPKPPLETSVMAPAPSLPPPTDYGVQPLEFAVESASSVVTPSERIPSEGHVESLAVTTDGPASSGVATLRAHLEGIHRNHLAFVEQQNDLHRLFLRRRREALSGLTGALAGATRPAASAEIPIVRSEAPRIVGPPTTAPSAPFVQATPSASPRQPEKRVETPRNESWSPPPRSLEEVETRGDARFTSPTSASTPAAMTPSVSDEDASATSLPAGSPPPPKGPTFDDEQLEIHAGGRISEIFGPAFAGQDDHPRQVRMPLPPLLFADRVTGLDAVPHSMGTGSIWTETDVRSDRWYVHDGRMPAGVMIESGQADLMLISYLGVDETNRGERVYRLLGCVLTFHGDLPQVGDTLKFDIHLDGHARQGPVRLMFFHSDCRIDGKVHLSVTQGQAGFFTDEELAGSDGCLWTPEEQELVADPRLDPPTVDCDQSRFDADAIRAVAEGRPWDCFGSGFDRARPHTRTPTLQGGRMTFFDTVEELSVAGGPWGRGYLRAHWKVDPDHWFFPGHFYNDPCMPGTLMFEGCLEAMAFYLIRMGYSLSRDGWRFQPTQGDPFKLSCRGQVTPASGEVTYEVFVEEVVEGPIPTLYADLLCTVDGLKAFHARRVGLQLVPAWPQDEGHPLLESGATPATSPVARAGDHEFGFPAMLACAAGRPSDAFGPIYERFDGPMRVARLPNPPYHFVTRATRIDGEIGGMVPGMEVEIEYDVPPDAWYFEENGCRVMPFAVLLEAALQPCGWLASYMGCALSVDRELAFRNLDGTGTQRLELVPTSGTLVTRVKNTSLSKTAGMIIVGFDVECRVGDEVAYEMDTVFGFFPGAALENQVGLPISEDHALQLSRGEGTPPRAVESSFGDGRPRLAGPGLLMIDRVVHFDPSGGREGLGSARAEKDIDAGEWFFKAHFFQDPVQPGSLGIEAMVQLLQWTMLEQGMDVGIVEPRFEALALDRPLTWKYRGQVTLDARIVSTTLEIVEAGQDEQGPWVVAEASLWADGKRIYEAFGLGMRIVSGGLDPAPRRRLDPGVDVWLADHCPTWTRPALPMMSMVDLLAQAADPSETVRRLVDVRVKSWLVFEDAPREIWTERSGSSVRLLALGGDDTPVEVATGRLECGRYRPAPHPLPALAGEDSGDPYADARLFHGPAFQLLERLILTGEGASSWLRADGSRATSDGDLARRVPRGRVHPALLDAATHGIPHDQLHLWDVRFSPSDVAYPALIPEIEFFGPPPVSGLVRCEVRPDGDLGHARFPAFEVQILGDTGLVWCRFRLVEACFPKGRLGLADPAARRAFLGDRTYVGGLSLATPTDEGFRLSDSEVAATDWLPGTVEAVYGARETEEIVRREVIAAAHGIHPSLLPDALPLTGFDLEVRREGETVTVQGDGRGRLDIEPVRTYWARWFGRSHWPVEDLYYGLAQRFIERVVVEDPKALAAVRGRPLLYVGNHQTGIESLLFSLIASALGGTPTATLAKVQHQESWLGRLIAHCFSYPGVRDPKTIAFFDREDPSSLVGILEQFGASEDPAAIRSLLVHVEGTRSLAGGQPVKALSGALLDQARTSRQPVIPVRFAGGLPREPLAERLEFPLGMGRQEIWIGRPILPEALDALHYGERRQLVLEAINDLGPDWSEEEPLPGDPQLEAAVASWQERTGVDPVHATLGVVLAEQPAPGEAVEALCAASSAADLATREDGDWLIELGRRLGFLR